MLLNNGAESLSMRLKNLTSEHQKIIHLTLPQ